MAMKDWTTAFTEPPSFNIEAFQQRLNAIAGLSRGEPILRLEWGGNAVTYKAVEWKNGKPIKESPFPKFKIQRNHELTIGTIDVPIQRWVITQRTEPEQIGYGSNTTFTDEMGDDKIIAFTPKDYYDAYIFVGGHSQCPADCSERKLCLGLYKEPNDAELNLIKEHTYKLTQDKIIDPYSRVTALDIERISKEKLAEMADEKQKTDQENDLRSMDWFRLHGHRLSQTEGKHFDLAQ